MSGRSRLMKAERRNYRPVTLQLSTGEFFTVTRWHSPPAVDKARRRRLAHWSRNVLPLAINGHELHRRQSS